MQILQLSSHVLPNDDFAPYLTRVTDLIHRPLIIAIETFFPGQHRLGFYTREIDDIDIILYSSILLY